VARSSTGRNLFVVNVTQVSAGARVSCGEPDENCLLVTPALGGDSSDPTAHGTLFQGDTLVYYDESLSPYAWRPGLSAGRLLVAVSPTLDAIFCRSASRGTAVACLGLAPPGVDATFARADLLVGKVDGPNEPLLAPVDSLIVANSADRGGNSRFGYGFPALAGDYVAWTTRETADGPELLRVQAVDDPESRVTVASDVHSFNVSADGKRWFWLQAIDRAGVGTLQTAEFPGGANASDVQASVIEYGLPPGAGSTVGTVTQAGDLFAIPDPVAAPNSLLALDSKVQVLLSFTDKGHVAYIKHFVGTNLSDLFVSNLDGSRVCALDTSTNVPFASVHFSPSAETAVWARSKADGFDALHSRLADCSTMPLAAGVVALDWLAGDAVVFINDVDADAGTGSLRFQQITGDQTIAPEGATLVANHVDTYAITGPDPDALLYTVNGAGEADGVYVRSFGH
jgi:hypothetical protein